jgi:lipoprotein-releasing system permease protein
MKFENFIALRYLKENRKNRNISTSSIIVITVIAAAIIFFISSVSIMNGYIYGIMKLSFEVKTFHIDYPIYRSYERSMMLLSKIRVNKEIKYAGLYREIKALLTANSRNSGLFYFRSVPEDMFDKDKGFDECIKLVRGRKSLGLNEIMLSRRTCEKLKVDAGDTVYLLAMVTKDTPELTLKRLKISGIFTTGYVELDEQLSYVGNGTADRIFANKNVGYNIFIKLNDFKKASEVVEYYSDQGINGMLSWQETNYNELTALKFERNVIALIVILVVLVASLNILTTIYITVYEKNQDIGILKAVGSSPANINIIFLLNGIYLGFIGMIIGIVSGLLITHWLNEILVGISHLINFFITLIYKASSVFITTDVPGKIEIFSKDFYLDRIYTEISFGEIVLISSLTLLFSILAALTPAIKAGNIKPIEVIKNG